MFAAQAAQAADDRGSCKASSTTPPGKPVTGALVKLKNAERRLTFMVSARIRGRFQAKICRSANTRCRASADDFQSACFRSRQRDDDGKREGRRGADRRARPVAAAGLAAAHSRGAGRQDLDGLQRSAGRRGKIWSPRAARPAMTSSASWSSAPTRTTGTTSSRACGPAWRPRTYPVVSDADTKKIVAYLSTNFKPVQPYDPNSRLPTDLLQGKALNYRAVTYDLADHFAEPHDVAMDPRAMPGSASAPAASAASIRARSNSPSSGRRPARRRRTARALAIRRSMRTASCGCPMAPTIAG